MTPSTCRGCGRPIYWALNPVTGKNVPIDVAPPVYRIYETASGKVECLFEQPGEGEKLGVNHFTTCTKADQFHKAKT